MPEHQVAYPNVRSGSAMSTRDITLYRSEYGLRLYSRLMSHIKHAALQRILLCTEYVDEDCCSLA